MTAVAKVSDAREMLAMRQERERGMSMQYTPGGGARRGESACMCPRESCPPGNAPRGGHKGMEGPEAQPRSQPSRPCRVRWHVVRGACACGHSTVVCRARPGLMRFAFSRFGLF